MKSMAYVCIVSGYNLPNLEGCLTRQPSDVLLVVSDDEQSFSEQANLLCKLLKKHLPNTKIHMLDKSNTGFSLKGEELLDLQEWVAKVLTPKLKTLNKETTVLNLNGGTKPLALAILQGYRWKWVDYIAKNAIKPQALRVLKNGQFKELHKKAQKTELSHLITADVLDIPCLVDDVVRENKPNRVIRKEPEASAALAKELWDNLQQQDSAISRLFKAFNQVWSVRLDAEGKPKPSEKILVLPWKDFLKNTASAEFFLTQEEALPWLRKFQSLMPSALNFTEETITLPGRNAESNYKSLLKWISGDWLEQLCYEWLLESGIPRRAIARSVTTGKGGAEREADLLIHYKGKTTLIEVKADLPPGEELKKLEEQLSSIGQIRFGHNNKILFCGPDLKNLLQENSDKAKSFDERCKKNNVQICTTRAELLKEVCNL